jgi:hypothetical protein
MQASVTWFCVLVGQETLQPAAGCVDMMHKPLCMQQTQQPADSTPTSLSCKLAQHANERMSACSYVLRGQTCHAACTLCVDMLHKPCAATQPASRYQNKLLSMLPGCFDIVYPCALSFLTLQVNLTSTTCCTNPVHPAVARLTCKQPLIVQFKAHSCYGCMLILTSCAVNAANLQPVPGVGMLHKPCAGSCNTTASR